MPQNNEVYCSSYVEHHLKPLRKTLIAKRKSRLMSCPQAFSPVYKGGPGTGCGVDSRSSTVPHLLQTSIFIGRENMPLFSGIGK